MREQKENKQTKRMVSDCLVSSVVVVVVLYSLVTTPFGCVLYDLSCVLYCCSIE